MINFLNNEFEYDKFGNYVGIKPPKNEEIVSKLNEIIYHINQIEERLL